jgi:hypothetical protein
VRRLDALKQTAVLRTRGAAVAQVARDRLAPEEMELPALDQDDMRFEYCDVVADFYEPIFKQSDDIELLELTLTRLIVMGRRHNRFHVHDVVTGILQAINDDVRSSVAVDVINNNLRESAWYAEAALKKPLRASVANALRTAQDRYGDSY